MLTLLALFGIWIFALWFPYWLHNSRGWSDGRILAVLVPLLILATTLTAKGLGWDDGSVGNIEDYCDVNVCK